MNSKIRAAITTSTLVAAVLGGSVFVTAAHADQDHGTKAQTDIPAWVTKPCAGPYSVNCRWIPKRHYAQQDLNHVSARRAMPGSARVVCVYFADKAYAKKHDYCS